ncbi:MAG: hypothetical protein AAF419_03645 [Pseudomonadota bacterium]
MSISHQDFYRLLPFGLKGIDYNIADDAITANYAGGNLKIIPGDEHKRKIASLELPVLYIEFKFNNVSPEDISMFFSKFNQAYQRGGG